MGFDMVLNGMVSLASVTLVVIHTAMCARIGIQLFYRPALNYGGW
jgi:hypothetical protein